MTFAPTKYVPIDYSTLGLAAFLLQRIGGNDTVSTLWEKVRGSDRIRTFDRFAEALTLLYALKILELKEGLLLVQGGRVR